MKIIFFNVWNGRIREGMKEFMKEQSVNTDIFCFQEVFNEMRFICDEKIPNHQEVFADREANPVNYAFSSATYIAKGITLMESSVIRIDKLESGFTLYTKVSVGDRDIHICNAHGISKPGEKKDTPVRIGQSQDIIDFLKDKKGLKIIGGDFNLLPETRSVKMFEETGYKDLIKDFNIKTTRNRLAWDMYPNKILFSDFIFASSDIKVKSFSVPHLEISDHLPLILDIEL
jgi:hypothetical protein